MVLDSVTAIQASAKVPGRYVRKACDRAQGGGFSSWLTMHGNSCRILKALWQRLPPEAANGAGAELARKSFREGRECDVPSLRGLLCYPRRFITRMPGWMMTSMACNVNLVGPCSKCGRSIGTNSFITVARTGDFGTGYSGICSLASCRCPSL